MSSLTVYSPQITIFDNVVSMIDGLYSLKDLHKASGGDNKHAPFRFMRNAETKDLIGEIERSPEMVNGINLKAYKVVQGGIASKQGTYVCKELVYRYAMWISPKFALLVIRTFDALITRTDAKQRECLVAACDKLAIGNTLRSDVYTMIAHHFGYERVTQIPTPLLPEAVAFVYEMILARQKPTRVIDESIVKDNMMWRYVGIIKHHEMSIALRDAKDVVDRLQTAIGSVQGHSNLIYDAFVEQKQLLALGKVGNEEVYAQARAFVARQDKLKAFLG